MKSRWIAAGLFATLCAPFGWGQIQYAQKVNEIKAGVLIVDSYQLGGKDANGEPFVWYNLDNTKNVKPNGWTFVNPHAAATMTQSIADRWSVLATNVGGNIATVGQTLTKGTAPYWEVFLTNANDAQLADFDVLSLTVRGNLSLTALERERLRGFVDQGGILWVDVDQTTTLDPINNLPLTFDTSVNPTGSATADLQHPLLSNPREITLTDIRKMQSDNSPGLTSVDPATYGAGSISPILETLTPEFDQIQPVASDPSGMLIGAARIGDGYMIVTARGVANSLNAGKNGANNQFFADAPSHSTAADAAASLVVNSIYLGSSYRESFFGSRKQNASAVDLHAPLLRSFTAGLSLNPGSRNFFPPATFKGLFVVSASDRLYVYDANPNKDIDGDGNPDDGLPDTDLSAGLDLLWVSAPLTAPISSPTCVDVKNPLNGYPSDQILVVDGNGVLHSFDAFAFTATPAPADLNNVAQAYEVSPPNGNANYDLGVDGHGPFAPTVHEGLAYIADSQNDIAGNLGRVWIMDPAAGDQIKTNLNPWFVGGTGDSGISEISGPATVGYLPIPNNPGGQDLVLYVPTRPNPAALGGPDSTAGITSLWLGAKGERPLSVKVDNNGKLAVATRASNNSLPIFLGGGNNKLGIRVSVFHVSTGNPLTSVEMASIFDGTVDQNTNGTLLFGLSGAWDDAEYSLRIDYRIDWSGTGQLGKAVSIRRGNLFFPDAGRTRRVIGAIAMGPNGNIFAVVGDQAHGGALYAIREGTPGLFRLLYRYELYDQHIISLNLTDPVTYRETFINEDGLNTLVPVFAGPITGLTMQGSPSVHNGMVFATATGQEGVLGLPVTVLMAFKEDQESVSIPVGNINDTFVLVQPDIARSVNSTQPEIYTIMQPSQFTYEQQADSGYIRMDTMMASRTGQIQQALSASQPVIIRRSGQPDQLIEPDAVGGTWSPLLWYSILAGSSNQSPPVVTGNTVFVSGNSKLPDILAGVAPGSATDRGVLFAMDADVEPLPPNAYPNSVRNWMNQVPLLTLSGSDIKPNEAIRWPQAKGVTSFADWQVRYYQTALKPGDTSYGIAAGDGALFTWGPSTLYGFRRGELLVADEGRLIRLDASGNPLWSADTSSGSGSSAIGTNTATKKGLIRPVRAYRIGEDQMVVADPSANRVVRMDQTGRELRSLSSFKLDASYRPEGFVTGSSLKLNGPLDVSSYTAYIPAAKNKLSNPNPLEYWIYYLVADSGNNRLLEIVDRYVADENTYEVYDPVLDANQDRQLGILTWVSPSDYSAKKFHYNNVGRVYNPSTGLFTYAGAMGNATPTRADLGLETPTSSSQREATAGNGGIILFDGAQTEVISQVTVPAISANVLWDDRPGVQAFSSPTQPQKIKPLGAITSMTMRYVTATEGLRLAVMFTDSTGVYEIYQPSVGVGQPWVVRWMLPQNIYKYIRRSGNIPTDANPRGLYATYARRLDSGEVLLTNGYLGKTRGKAPFTGEVLLLDGDFDFTGNNLLPGFSLQKWNFGFSSLSIKLQLSDLDGVRNITAPVFADLR